MSAIIGQVLPFLSQEHQQQVATAVERAKQVVRITKLENAPALNTFQVTMADLNSAIGASGGGGAAGGGQRPDIARLMQLHAQAQAGQAASIASLVNGPPGLPGLPPGALGLPPGLQGLPPGLNIPTSLSSSLLQVRENKQTKSPGDFLTFISI